MTRLDATGRDVGGGCLQMYELVDIVIPPVMCDRGGASIDWGGWECLD